MYHISIYEDHVIVSLEGQENKAKVFYYVADKEKEGLVSCQQLHDWIISLGIEDNPKFQGKARALQSRILKQYRLEVDGETID